MAMSRAGELTPERAIIVRAATEDVARRELWKWGVSDETLAAAGVGTHGWAGDPQKAVDLHMALLGMAPREIEWVDWRIGERWDLDPEWEAPLWHSQPGVGNMLGLPPRVARLFGVAGGEAWQPLIAMVRAGYWPFGPKAKGGPFMVARPNA